MLFHAHHCRLFALSCNARFKGRTRIDGEGKFIRLPLVEYIQL